SYPATGSTGDGYELAHRLGHNIVPIRPALVPLVTSHPEARFMSGLLLRNIAAQLIVDGEVVQEEFGEFSFSPHRIDGAVVLRMSRKAVDALIDEKNVKISLDLKPALDEPTIIARLEREMAEAEQELTIGELLRKVLPRELVIPVAKAAGLISKHSSRELREDKMHRVVEAMKRFVLPISDYRPFEEAIVTAGGVSLDEIWPDTMESKLVGGLYFAGEVMDIDADTGGYNLQMAFSTGYLAGQLRKHVE
ncbi:MAG: aminoacetone oxidase family FAD-binding enzyme, partial [Tidjanibacter sp.]|nr:aminoacetone oxidase family FAD-binding enzyme [Tidjanibacter sp.]